MFISLFRSLSSHIVHSGRAVYSMLVLRAHQPTAESVRESQLIDATDRVLSPAITSFHAWHEARTSAMRTFDFPGLRHIFSIAFLFSIDTFQVLAATHARRSSHKHNTDIQWDCHRPRIRICVCGSGQTCART